MADGSDVQMWATAISTNAQNGQKIIFRYAKAFAPPFDRASQPIRIIIIWKYQSERSGQPVADEHQQMNLMEDALESALRKNCHFATLAMVSTGEDLREWTYYVKSEDEFMSSLNYAFAEMPAFPIEIHTAYDPSWDMYENSKPELKRSSIN